MATPHVAGAAALVIARFPNISVFDLRQRLLATTVPVDSLNGRSATGGRLNAYNALTANPDGTLEISISSSSALISGRSATLVVQVTDLTAVPDATVTGTATGLGAITFRNDGISPDSTAKDHLYTATITVPAGTDQLVLTVQVSAPSKTSRTLNFSFQSSPLQATTISVGQASSQEMQSRPQETTNTPARNPANRTMGLTISEVGRFGGNGPHPPRGGS